MKYITHNENDLINTNMTSLRGAIMCPFSDLQRAFGNPMKDGYDDYKSDAEWKVQFENGTVATIYNWKNGKNYCGDQGLEVWEITEWHIGGHEFDCVHYVRNAVDNAKEVA